MPALQMDPGALSPAAAAGRHSVSDMLQSAHVMIKERARVGRLVLPIQDA